MECLPTTVGIEVEVNPRDDINVDFYDIARAFRREGFRGWRTKEDFSCGRQPGQYGIELVSDIFKTKDQLDTVSGLVDLLRALGFSVNSRCGLHVHLGCHGTTIAQRQNLYRFLYRHEEAFFAMAGPVRQHNPFCARLPRQLADSLRAGHDAAAWRDDFHPRGNKRHFWVNGSQSRWPTVEFRLMGCRLDAAFILDWVQLLLKTYVHAIAQDTGTWRKLGVKTACADLEALKCSAQIR